MGMSLGACVSPAKRWMFSPTLQRRLEKLSTMQIVVVLFALHSLHQESGSKEKCGSRTCGALGKRLPMKINRKTSPLMISLMSTTILMESRQSSSEFRQLFCSRSFDIDA